jgi:UDP-glucose 4-epimerase
MMRCLVTGGAGFIGSNISREALVRGHEVRILDDFSTGRRSNLTDIGPHVELIEGDLRCYETVRKAVEGIEVVFHEGALSSVPRSISDPLPSDAVNVGGSLHVLWAAREAGCRRVLFASSSSIYGEAPEQVKSESLPARPLSPYAVTKMAAERYFQVFHRIYGLETVALRYFNVFGPFQDPDSPYAAVIPLFVKAFSEGRAPVINGSGEQSRDFTFIDNVVLANFLAADAPGAPGLVMNIACGDSITVNRLATDISGLLGKADIQPRHAPARPGDVMHSRADISLARTVLGYSPVVTFDAGLARTVGFLTRM